MALTSTSELRVVQCDGMVVLRPILLMVVNGQHGQLNSLISLLMEEICMLEQTLGFVNMFCQL